MKIGKLPPEVLERVVLTRLGTRREDVLVHSGFGEDSSVIDFGDFVCVLSTDPITGATRNLGRLVIHISCNDVASNGARPIGALVTLLGPPSATEEDFGSVMQEAHEAAKSLGIEILGGHTEVTGAVTRMVAISTVVGRARKGNFVTSSGARPGDAIILTKSAGLEGTAVIASEFENDLRARLGDDIVERALDFFSNISVVPEGMIAAENGATAMHDATEGGVLGAIYELVAASGAGALVYVDDIPVAPQTQEICRAFSLDPLRLVSSGSMVITAPSGEAMVEALTRSGIPARVVGRVTEFSEGRTLVRKSGQSEPLLPPGVDELYKVTGPSGL